MSLSLGHLVLYSRAPQEVANFFSELLDMDITPDKGGEGIWVKNDSLRLFITPASADQLFHKGGERDIMVEFALDSQEALEDLLHKVQFLSYRHGHGGKGAKKAQLSKVGQNVFFFLKDPDGRRWKFSWTDLIS